MSREILDSVWSASGIRLIGDGVPAGDVMAAQASLTHWDEWFPYWTGLGDTYERLGREALTRNRRQSAGELFWQACLSHHYAQFLWFHDPVRRDQGQMRKVALYREAAPLFVAPAVQFDVPFDGFVIPGYLRLLPGASGRVPVVIVLGGLESTKEESYRFENLCLARGLATCTFDGPGQGEMYFQAKLRPDFHRFTSAVLDWLAKRPEIDADRIGIIGRSLGGFSPSIPPPTIHASRPACAGACCLTCPTTTRCAIRRGADLRSWRAMSGQAELGLKIEGLATARCQRSPCGGLLPREGRTG